MRPELAGAWVAFAASCAGLIALGVVTAARTLAARRRDLRRDHPPAVVAFRHDERRPHATWAPSGPIRDAPASLLDDSGDHLVTVRFGGPDDPTPRRRVAPRPRIVPTLPASFFEDDDLEARLDVDGARAVIEVELIPLDPPPDGEPPGPRGR